MAIRKSQTKICRSIPHRVYCVWRRERWGGKRSGMPRDFMDIFFSFCARTWLFAPTCCYNYASMCFRALFLKLEFGERSTCYCGARSRVQVLNTAGKKEGDRLNRILQMA